MASNIAELLSILLVLAYFYKKTKSRIPLWVLGYTAYFFICAILFRKLYPNIPFVSPTCEYMGFLFVVGVPFLAVLVFVSIEAEKQQATASEDNKPTVLFKPTRENVIFWTVIVLINLAAFIMGNGK